MERLSIFGSCVSRDVFRLYPSQDIELKSYIARQSVCSAVSNPMQNVIKIEDIKNPSPFQQRIVYYDLSKKTFDVLGHDGSTWLIVDLIDERFPLLSVGETIITESEEFVKSGGLPGAFRILRKFDGANWFVAAHCIREDIHLFCQRLLKIYDSKHIILHKAYATDKYRSKEGKILPYSSNVLIAGENLNNLLRYMYEIFEKYLPGVKVVDCHDQYIGDARHLWGLSNVHYEDEYYENIMREIRKIVLGE